MEYLTTLLVAIIGGLGFMLFRRYKDGIELRANRDLKDQEHSSNVVDEKVDSAQGEIDSIQDEIKSPVEDNFWDKYTKDK